MCKWVYVNPPKNWNFQSEAKVEQIIAIVTTHSVFWFFFVNQFFRNNCKFTQIATRYEPIRLQSQSIDWFLGGWNVNPKWGE